MTVDRNPPADLSKDFRVKLTIIGDQATATPYIGFGDTGRLHITVDTTTNASPVVTVESGTGGHPQPLSLHDGTFRGISADVTHGRVEFYLAQRRPGAAFNSVSEPSPEALTDGIANTELILDRQGVTR